jgi:hypothetical protein
VKVAKVMAQRFSLCGVDALAVLCGPGEVLQHHASKGMVSDSSIGRKNTQRRLSLYKGNGGSNGPKFGEGGGALTAGAVVGEEVLIGGECSGRQTASLEGKWGKDTRWLLCHHKHHSRCSCFPSSIAW